MKRRAPRFRLASLVVLPLWLLAGFASPAGAACSAFGSATPSQQLCSLSAYPAAVCNDGTPGVYYVRHGNPASRTWLFYLQGGGGCNSDATCAAREQRSRHYTGSAGWQPKLHGILSPDPAVNPVLANANVVAVHYCSSDYWSGAKAAAAAFGTQPPHASWAFQGRAIAVAALRDLLARDGATHFSKARRILFAGSSAGGIGITITLHDLLPLVPAGARTLLANDAGFALDIGGFDPSAPDGMSARKPLNAMIAAGIEFWHGHGDTPCSKAAATAHQQVECYNSARLLSDGSIAQDSFTAEAQLDTAQLWLDGYGIGHVRNALHKAYAAAFACAMRSALQASRRSNSLYAPQRFAHQMFTDDASFTAANQFPGGALSASAALAGWLADPGRRTVHLGNAMGIPCPPQASPQASP